MYPAMGNQYDDDVDDDDYEDESDNINSLRKQLRQKTKELKAAQTENATLKKDGRTRTVADTIKDKGLDPRIAAFVPADVEDVGKWVDEFGDLFATAQASADGDDAPPASGALNPDGTGFVTEEELAAHGVIQSVTQPANAAAASADLMAKMKAAGNQEELLKLVGQAG